MPIIKLSVRFYGQDTAIVAVDTVTTAFMMVDCDVGCDGERDPVIAQYIASALAAARQIGMHVFYFHEDAYGIGGPKDITWELHGSRHGKELPPDLFAPPQWRVKQSVYPISIAPSAHEPDFPKQSKDGFQTTNADYYLKTWGIDTLIAVGFALRSCLYHTCMGARHHNYRVIMLRDCTTPPGSSEFPDTLDETNPEGGWMRFVFLRQFETNIGYTSTSHEFVQACKQAPLNKNI